jgi:cell division protein FtsW
MTKRARTLNSFVIAAFALSIFGLIMLFSVSVPLSQQNFGESYYYFKHQALYGFGLGLILFLIGRYIPIKLLQRLAPWLLVLAASALLFVFAPSLGLRSGGARSWIDLSIFTFQPAEIAKLALVVYLAAWFDRRRAAGSKKTGALFHFLILTGVVVVPILLQPDYGTAAVIAATALIMYFIAGARLKSILLILLLGAVVFGGLLALSPERASRITTFLSPEGDTQGEGYQSEQALIAIGSGGFLGRGLGHSIQKYQYLPESMGDAIFAIIAEELGFLGAAAVVLAFLFLLTAGLRVARAAPTNFGKFLAAGVVSWLGLQAFVNIGGIIGLIPFTGIPLPFISYGGTALAIELAAVGLVSNIARQR